MKTFSIGALIAAAAALGLSILCTFTLDNALSWTDRVNLIFDPASAESFDAYYFAFGTLPRFAAAAIGGALLGLVGSLLQQLTQNPMTSPLTLGTSSGGWLAVVLISAFFPAAAGAWLSLGVFAGALAAFGLILLIAGPRGMTGVALIIAGMVVNLLFGAIATAVVLLRAQFVENVFLWGAGDLAQNGWGGITALLPQTVPVVILLLIFAPRALALISLGDEGARARGLPIVPVFGVLAALGIWLSSAFIAAAGVINFTGLIAPNIARRVGFVNPRTQLCVSMLIGRLSFAPPTQRLRDSPRLPATSCPPASCQPLSEHRFSSGLPGKASLRLRAAVRSPVRHPAWSGRRLRNSPFLGSSCLPQQCCSLSSSTLRSLIERAYGHLHWQISLNCSCVFLGLLLPLQPVPA